MTTEPLAFQDLILTLHKYWGDQGCAILQVASFIPMIVGAFVGALPMWVLFLVAGVYWLAYLRTPRP